MHSIDSRWLEVLVDNMTSTVPLSQVYLRRQNCYRHHRAKIVGYGIATDAAATKPPRHPLQLPVPEGTPTPVDTSPALCHYVACYVRHFGSRSARGLSCICHASHGPVHTPEGRYAGVFSLCAKSDRVKMKWSFRLPSVMARIIVTMARHVETNFFR